MTVATVVIGLINYLYSLGSSHILDVGDFAVFAAGQAILLSAGTWSNTAVPWVLARALAMAESQHDPRQATWFTVVANPRFSLLAGVAVAGLSLRFAPLGPVLVVGFSTWLVFLASTTSRLREGDQRFGLLGVLRIGDVATKVLVGTALVLAGAGVTGAVSVFAAGSLLLLVVGVWLGRHDIRTDHGAPPPAIVLGLGLRCRRRPRADVGFGHLGLGVLVAAIADNLGEVAAHRWRCRTRSRTRSVCFMATRRSATTSMSTPSAEPARTPTSSCWT